MTGLFLSYAREDEAVAASIAASLEAQGHSVWWDRRLAGGSEYSRIIEQAIADSDAVLVLWSARSLESAWVRDEAAAGRDADKLIPLTIDGCSPPLGFRQFHTIDMSDRLRNADASLPPALIAALDGGSATDALRERRPEQRISFCRTADGVTLAYSRTGNGPPLVKVANWLNHLEHEWENPLWTHWLDELSANHSLLRYDERGNGMSDWNVPSLNFELLVDDLITVADAAGLERFDLFAISQGSPVAIAFAARFPERVRRMVLVNGFAAGWRHSNDPVVIEQWNALARLAGTGWGNDNPGFRQVFTSLFFPDATPEQARWWNVLQKQSASPENAERFIQLFGEINVAPLLREVKVPTLVVHCRGDQLVPLEAGRGMASRIPGAEFVALDSANHLPLQSDPGWPKLQQQLRQFLASHAVSGSEAPPA